VLPTVHYNMGGIPTNFYGVRHTGAPRQAIECTQPELLLTDLLCLYALLLFSLLV